MTLMQDKSKKRRRKETQYQQKTANVMFLSISQAALLMLRSQSFGAMARSLGLLVMLSTTRDANLCSSNNYLQFLFMIISMKWHLISLKKGPGELIWDHLLPHILNTCHTITAIQRLNWEILEKKAYHGMDLFDKKMANVCYQFLPTDNVTLYRKFSCKNGVDVHRWPEYNVHYWLDPLSLNFQCKISDSIFHYSARSEANERFQVCISTNNMNTAAWKYTHCSQLVLDGTFGICTLRLLLFIALAQDENRFPLLSFFSQHWQVIKRHTQVTIQNFEWTSFTLVQPPQPSWTLKGVIHALHCNHRHGYKRARSTASGLAWDYSYLVQVSSASMLDKSSQDCHVM